MGLIIVILIFFVSEHNQLQEHMANILVPLAIVDQVIFNVILLYLLFRKLFVILVKRGTQQSMDSLDASSNDVIQLDTLQTTTRYSTLVLLGICSTFTCSIFVAFSLYFPIPTGLFFSIDTIVNATTLYLMFSVNQDLYKKLCGKYHQCFHVCCVYCSYNKFKEENKEKTKEQYATL